MKKIDITGVRFGRLVAMQQLPPVKPGDGYRWVCNCDCGKTLTARTRLLTYKNGMKSCGCIRNEKNKLRPHRNSTNLKHGHTSRTRSREYVAWSSMIQRCTNSKHVSFKNYGGKGVTVCAEWLNSFECFFEDMGKKPDKHSIDRIDPNGPYNKENCRWATSKEQSNNRRVNRRVVFHGVEMTCAELAEKINIPYRTVLNWANKISEDFDAFIDLKLAKIRAKESPR